MLIHCSLISSPSNTDTLLLTTSYTLHLLHSLLNTVQNTRLTLATIALARSLSKTAPEALLPGETLVATISSNPNSRVVRASHSAVKLAELIDDFRIFSRLFGLVGIWLSASKAWRNPHEDRIVRWTIAVQVLSIAIFQALENAAYLASKGVFALKKSTISKSYVWSARFWATYVGLEFVRLGRTRVLARRKQLEVGASEKEDAEVAKVEKVKREARWWRDIYVNAAWAPMTVHYGLQGGFMGEGLIAVLGLLPGLVGLREAWAASA